MCMSSSCVIYNFILGIYNTNYDFNYGMLEPQVKCFSHFSAFCTFLLF